MCPVGTRLWVQSPTPSPHRKSIQRAQYLEVTALMRVEELYWVWLSQLDLLGIPDTSFRGLSTRTALRVRRSKSVPAVARILEKARIRDRRVSTWVHEETTLMLTLCSLSPKGSNHSFLCALPSNHKPGQVIARQGGTELTPGGPLARTSSACCLSSSRTSSAWSRNHWPGGESYSSWVHA